MCTVVARGGPVNDVNDVNDVSDVSGSDRSNASGPDCGCADRPGGGNQRNARPRPCGAYFWPPVRRRVLCPHRSSGADHRSRNDHVRSRQRVDAARGRFRPASGERGPCDRRQRRLRAGARRERPSGVSDIGPAAGREPDHDGVRRGRRAAQPQRRCPVHDLRAGSGARSVPLLRSAGPQGQVDPVSRGARGMGGRQQPRGERPRGARWTDSDWFRRNAAHLPVPVRLRGRQVLGRARGAPRSRAPHVSPRERRGEDRAQPRRHLRFARRRTRLDGAVHRHPVPVRQVRHRDDSGVPVRRDGASRGHLLQRERPAPRWIGHSDANPRPRQRDFTRDRPHVVRRSRHDALVRRCLDERSVREFHGGEDRQPVVSGGQPRSAVPARQLPRRLRRRSHGRHQRDPAAARQPQRGGDAVRRHHLSKGADRDAAARAPRRPRLVAGRSARVPARARVRQRLMVRSHRVARQPHAGGSGCVEPCVG